MLDPCRDLRGALGAAALEGTDPPDDIALRAHLDGCAACRAELRELTQVARALGSVPLATVDAAPAEPSGALAGRVLDRLARERAAARSRHVRRVLTSAAVIGSVAAAVIAVVLVLGSGSGPGGTRVVLPAVGREPARATAVLRAAPAGTEVEMEVTGLRRGDYYWLWITDDEGHRLGAGTFRGSDDTITPRFTAAMRLSDARRIWVTDGDDRVVLDARVPLST